MPNTIQLQRDLEYLCLPETPWMPIRYHQGEKIKDVVIIGAGMAGATVAAALKFAGINNIQLIDKAPNNYEGPWNTHARMQTLRSPKELTGPALGIPSLTFRAWYCAQFGESAWEQLDRIPTRVWHNYLQWYKKALDLPVRNNTELTAIKAVQAKQVDQPIAQLNLITDHKKQTIYARHVVLATGMDGLGSPFIPTIAKELSKKTNWAHSSEQIDFSAIKHKNVAIIGGGDSALDAAATALDTGAASAHIFIKATDFSQINYWKAYTHSGHRQGFATLNTEQKHQLLQFLLAQRTPPARGTIQRLSTYKNLHLHFDHRIHKINELPNNKLLLQAKITKATAQSCSSYQADFVIFATGYQTDLSQRPELNEIVPHLALVEESQLGQKLQIKGVPQLHADFSFVAQKNKPAYPLLEQIHCFTSQALFSVGKLGGDIPSMSVAATRISEGISAKLYQAEFEEQLAAVKAYDEKEVSDEALRELIEVAGQHIRDRMVV